MELTHNPLRKIRTLLFNSFVAALLVFTLQACGDDDDDNGPTDPPTETGNIVEVAESEDDFSDLVSALSDADLVSTLEGDGPFTVFAPTNEAFADLEVDISTLSNDELVEILTYHVIEANIASGDLEPQQSVETISGGEIFVTADNGDVMVNDIAAVVDADIEASNGTIHAVDQVLLPDSYQDVVSIIAKRYNLQALEDAVVSEDLASALQDEGPFTIFAPTNEAFENADLEGEDVAEILQYHVLPQEVLSGDLDAAQTVETLQGDELTIEAADGSVTITDNSGQTYEVQQADLQGTNGVVHIINGVLNPNPDPNIVEVAIEDGNFTTLVDALGQTGLDEALQEAGPFTVFAPTDDAFSDVDLSGLSDDELAEILQYHVISANILSTDLEAEQSVEALAGGDLFVTANGNVIVNDVATVVAADVEASNGTIHAIDNVLLPDAYQTVVGIISKRYGLQTLEDAVVDADLVSTLEGEGPFTVFAPSNDAFEGVDLSGLSQQELEDILTYHVLPEEVLSGDLDAESTITVETVNGAELEVTTDAEGGVTLTDQAGNTATVTTVDLGGTNGVVHIIDGVLMPSE